jgi:hypothetical protein
VSGSALLAAKPPRMKKYPSWIEILKDLHENVTICINSISNLNVLIKNVLQNIIKESIESWFI